MTLTENESKIFWVHEAWQDYCVENNIVDPWKWIRQCEDKVNKRWVETTDKGYTIWHYSQGEWPNDIREEYKQAIAYRDQYMIDREIWEGKYILEEYDYALLEHFYKMHRTDAPYDVAFRKWFETVKPCESQEGQCNIFCPQFTSCEYREEFVPPLEEQK